MTLPHSLETVPEVVVLSPKLKGRKDDAKIPHTYPGKKPCLYFPWGKDWNPAMLIAETIVPWAVHWLCHYEVWLVTGEWLGGGIHLDREAKPMRCG